MDMVTNFKSSSRLKSSSSSVQVVLNQDENLLTLILLRVPLKKLMSLKWVSRQWRSLITNQQFTSLYDNFLPLRASGLFIQHCDKVRFVALDDHDTPSPFRTLAFAPHDPYPRSVRILRSCNGLLLCSTTYSASLIQRKCYVYNPCTNQLATLPKHRPTTPVDYVGLAFDPSKSLHYKVIAFVKTSPSHNAGDFHIYSSKTKTWNVSLRSFVKAPGLQFDGGVYWHGCLHWLSTGGSDCLYFNVDKGTVEPFPKPPLGGRSTLKGSLYFGESEDHLHVTKLNFYGTLLTVYEMKSDYSEWFVKYRFNLASVSKVFPEMTNHKARFEGGYSFAVGVLSLIRRENVQEDSFLVLEIPGKAIRYNLVDKSFKVIWDSAVDFSLEVDLWEFGQLKVWPFIETMSFL